MKEGYEIATLYRERSVAEQNSLHLAWSLLMDQRFEALRNTICATPEEKKRFRELVVNSVMATDIVDKDLVRFSPFFPKNKQSYGSAL